MSWWRMSLQRVDWTRSTGSGLGTVMEVRERALGRRGLLPSQTEVRL